MTKEQVKKHGKVIKWFCDNSSKGVYKLTSIGWKQVFEPNFYPTDKYVQNDEYVEFRKALADGKLIQYLNGHTWVDISIAAFSLPVENYRIKPDEPKFEKGDWVIYDNQSEYELGQWNEVSNEKYNKSTCKDCYTKWKPQGGELCVFWDNDNIHKREFWVVSKFESICKDKYYQDINGNRWDNIAPLEYVNTLKDK